MSRIYIIIYNHTDSKDASHPVCGQYTSGLTYGMVIGLRYLGYRCGYKCNGVFMTQFRTEEVAWISNETSTLQNKFSALLLSSWTPISKSTSLDTVESSPLLLNVLSFLQILISSV